MKILIVDSAIEIIDRLEEILSESKSILIIDKVVSYKDAIRLFDEIRHDVVLLDLGLPASRSFDLIWDIKKSNSQTAIIVLSIHTDIPTQEQCRKLGADFFLDKYNDFEKITHVINVMMANKKKNGERNNYI